MSQFKELLKISDLNMASAMLCAGFNIIGIDDTNPSRLYFYFDRNPDTEGAVKRYWGGNLMVDAKALGSYRREILTMIHQGDRV